MATLAAPASDAVSTVVAGLLPIMWSSATEAGADVMKRIATPMIGGIVTSAIMELLIYPVIYVLWKKRGLKRQEKSEIPFVSPGLIPSASS